MNIMIDGPDGTGKTTICEMMSELFKIPLIKMPNMKKYFENGMTEEFSQFYNELIVQFKDTDFVQDRGFTSSLVYGKVYDRHYDYSYIDAIENELKPKVFILTATDDVLFERRPTDEIITQDFRIEVNKEYRNLAAERGYTLIDTSNLTIEEVKQEILKYV
jgi:thymidylate kinase